MSPPISSTVKERVIQLFLEGKGRNAIAEILNLSHIRISQGSVTKILRAYKANTGQACIKATTDFPKASEPSASPFQLQTSPMSEMKEEAQIPISESQDSGQEPLSIEDAKDPEKLITPATSTPAVTVTTSSNSIPSSSFPVTEALPYLSGMNSYPHSYSHFNLGYLNPQISEVNMRLVNRVNPVCQQDSEKEKETTHVEAQELQVQSSENQESFMDLGWSMVFGEVMEAKKQRRDELLLIEQKKRELEQQRIQLDRARYDLEIREIRLLEAEPLIPIARQLQDLGTDITQFLPWVETIHEKAQAENIPTLTKAAYSLAQDLRMYRQLAGLKKSIQVTTQQLEMLNMSLEKQQQAIMTLLKLHSAGISESEIVELIGLVNQWGVRQRNGMNGSSRTSGGKANEFMFKLDDKLNV
jgi:hypothetical protein